MITAEGVFVTLGLLAFSALVVWLLTGRAKKKSQDRRTGTRTYRSTGTLENGASSLEEIADTAGDIGDLVDGVGSLFD